MNEFIEKPDIQYVLHIQSGKNVEKRLIDFCLESAVDVFEDTGLTADVQPLVDVQPIVEAENIATVSDEFICKNCGIYLKDYTKVVLDEYDDGFIDELHYEYEPKYCPECGAKVESRIKTPKRDEPLYTMDEICKMNGVEFNPR